MFQGSRKGKGFTDVGAVVELRFSGGASDMFNNPNLFVISGGPGSGKTTVLQELAKLGFAYAPEVARKIIQEETSSGGTALPWQDREAYSKLMLSRSIESYLEHSGSLKITFSDRGIPDTLCYARLIGVLDTAEAESACRTYRYAPVVFLAPPWRAIYETDDERKQDFAEAVRTYDEMTKVYEECGYQVSILPKLDPADRAKFILERVHFVPGSSS